MELHLIVPVPEGSKEEVGDEKIAGKTWRVTGPHDIEDVEKLKFHCISYVWGPDTEKEGSFFNCKRKISDQTRPALTAAIKAARGVQEISNGPIVEAFWIDAICIPQVEESPQRQKTLESMGFIYSVAVSVLIVLRRSICKIIELVSSEVSPRALSNEEMQKLEEDKWVNRVWTYQELVNGREIFFTTHQPTLRGHVIDGERFFNCVGFFLNEWLRRSGKGQSAVLEKFPNLNALEDALVDRQMGDYLDRTALGVLSNMALRQFTPQYPQSRLLACVGALTREVSSGPSSTTLAEISDKLMTVCEVNKDYSFIYTSDLRSSTPGIRWRPSPSQPSEDTNLAPVISWHSYGTQSSHRDSDGLWLDNMMLLEPAETIDEEIEKALEGFAYGTKDLQHSNTITGGIFRCIEGEKEEISQVLLRFLRMIGFTGDQDPQVCKAGLFFSQVKLKDRDSVEMYAASGIQWAFGSPGLAKWKEAGEAMYCAGVAIGATKTDVTKSLLLE